MKRFTLVLLTMVLIVGLSMTATAANRFSVATGNWNATATWSATSGGAAGATAPVAGDVVTIEEGYTVTVNTVTAACASITLGGASHFGNRTGTLTFATTGNPVLTVSGAVQVGATANNASNGIITFVSGASMSVGSLTMGNATTTAASTLTMTATSTLTVGSLAVAGTGTKTWTPSTGTVILATTNTLPATIFTTFNNLTISGATTLGVATTVNGTLTFTSANLTLGAYNLTLGTTATVSGAAANQCVVTNGAGVVSRSIAAAGNFSFPIAPVASNFNPVSIKNNSAGAVTYTALIKAISPAAPTPANGLNYMWTLTGAASSTLSFTWSNADAGSGLAALPGNGTAWDYTTLWVEAGGATSGTPNVTSGITATTAAGNWTIGLTGQLPVEMTSFTATAQQANALLAWSTATEVNNFGFNIERRAIASNVWAKVGFVAGNGTSNAKHNYTYADNNLSVGTYAYRIKQIDNDGTFKYSASTEVTVAGVPKELKLFGNYPNPFNPSTKVQFTVPENGNVRLSVYNVLGQEVATLFNGSAVAGNLYTTNFDASRMASGLYFSVLEFGNQRITHKMLLTK